MGKTITLLAVLALTACTTTRGGFCDLSQPLRPSKAAFEAMSEREIDALLVHNKTGVKLCGWKP
jgi:hypothetical protein